MNTDSKSDSSRPEFWDARFTARKMPWDCLDVPDKLTAYLSQALPGRALIRGCVSAYEVAAFHAAGWSVTAINFSSVAVDRAKNLLGTLARMDTRSDAVTSARFASLHGLPVPLSTTPAPLRKPRARHELA